MPTETQPTLLSFADWVRATDPRASQRLPLLERAGRLLAGEATASPEERLELAGKLERWRYQWLDERSATPALNCPLKKGATAGLSSSDSGENSHSTAGQASSGTQIPEKPLFQRAAIGHGLANALDLAANELAGRDPRPPRDPRRAIHDPSRDAGPIAEAKLLLDSEVELEEVTRRASRLTLEWFGAPESSGRPTSGRRRMLLYAPLYLSSHCTNHCTYCGFRDPHQIDRRHLSLDEALREAEILSSRGFRHILLVAGDFPRLTTPEYFAGIISALKAKGIDPAIEIAPQTTGAYARLVAAGACGVTLYQETYHEDLYGLYHPRGTKSRFDWRLEGIERAAEAGMRRLGLGVLLGLADPREDFVAMMRHAVYLERRFPDRRLAFSLPRIYEAPQGFEPPYPVDDETFLRLYCALRIAFPEAELVLSTREPAALRNRLAQICITQMSAGSRTVPGGYQDTSSDPSCGQQFPISDHRTPAQVAAWLEDAGFDPLWEIP